MDKKVQNFSVTSQGDSMYPLLKNGDIVEYARASFNDIQLHDIVLVYVKNVLVTHRVIYMTKKICITRGDNNASADTVIQKESILAKAIRFKRKGVWHDLQDVYRVQSTLYLNEIQKLETLLHLNKISHVFLKGVLVSLRYEGSIPKRIYADCYVLIKREDQKNTEKIFSMLGYTIQGRKLFTQKTKKRANQPEVSYLKMVRGIPVIFDVHFEPVFLMTQLDGMNLLYPSQLLKKLGESILKRGEMIKIKGFTYSFCSISDQILYLALHIFHHNFTDSVRYQLLDAVIRKSATTKIWDEVHHTVKEYRLEGYVYGVFILLKKYFKTPIPPSFLYSVRPSFFMSHFIHYATNHIDIFSQDQRLKAGVERFILIFFLSPQPFWKKILVFYHPEVLVAGYKLVPLFFIKKK